MITRRRVITFVLALLLLSGLEAQAACTRFWVGGTGTWNATAGTKWATTSGGSGGASIPTNTDDVCIDGNSGNVTVTQNVGSACRDLDFTNGGTSNFTGTFNNSASFTISGSLRLSGSMTWSFSGAITMNATDARTITTAGKSLGGTSIAFNGVNGSWTLQDNYTSTSSLTLTNGSFADGGRDLSITIWSSNNSNARTITCSGTPTWTLTSTGTIFNMPTATGATITGCSSGQIIKITDSSATTKTFANSGLSFGTLWCATAGGSGACSLSGANSLAFKIDAGSTVSLPTAGNATTTCRSPCITSLGTSGTHAILKSNNAGTKATITQASGCILAGYTDITDQTGTGGATFKSQGTLSNTTGWSAGTTCIVPGSADLDYSGSGGF